MILSEFYAFWFDFSFIAGNFRRFNLFVENFGLNWVGNGVQVGSLNLNTVAQVFFSCLVF
jgi:hypothetical protein